MTASPLSPVSKTQGDAEASVRTQASVVTDLIRRDIILGVFPPQSKLKLRDLAERYEIGVIPLREALSRLVLSGFIEAEDHRGFRVARTSEEELLDITGMRQEMESAALRASIENGDLTWEVGIIAAFHRLDNTARVDPAFPRTVNPAWEEAHDAFHYALLSACGSGWRLKVCKMLSEQADRYRHMSVVTEKQTVRDVGKEHKDLADAVLARDVDLACLLLQRHFVATTNLALTRIRAG